MKMGILVAAKRLTDGNVGVNGKRLWRRVNRVGAVSGGSIRGAERVGRLAR